MINEKYSFKDFTGQDLSDHDPAGFYGVIKGSCFAQEMHMDEKHNMRKIFPAGIECTFERCNLDNVDIPRRSKIQPDCSNRCIKVQNDREDWILEDNIPKEPINKKQFEKLGVPIDPKYIPKTIQSENILSIIDEQLEVFK